jgi:hypothetical protein
MNDEKPMGQRICRHGDRTRARLRKTASPAASIARCIVDRAPARPMSSAEQTTRRGRHAMQSTLASMVGRSISISCNNPVMNLLITLACRRSATDEGRPESDLQRGAVALAASLVAFNTRSLFGPDARARDTDASRGSRAAIGGNGVISVSASCTRIDLDWSKTRLAAGSRVGGDDATDVNTAWPPPGPDAVPLPFGADRSRGCRAGYATPLSAGLRLPYRSRTGRANGSLWLW